MFTKVVRPERAVRHGFDICPKPSPYLFPKRRTPSDRIEFPFSHSSSSSSLSVHVRQLVVARTVLFGDRMTRNGDRTALDAEDMVSRMNLQASGGVWSVAQKLRYDYTSRRSLVIAVTLCDG